MDSFYGVPRRPPAPPTIRPIQHTPLVPEVSIIDNSFFPQQRMPPPMCPEKSYNSSIFSKKHVRFKGPHFEKENVPQTFRAVPDLKGKTFKQIYMANVPDHHLDLSIFEPPRVETTSKTCDLRQFKDNSVDVLMRLNEERNLDATRLQSIENKPASPKYRDSSPIKFRPESAPVVSKTRSPPRCTEICTQTESPITDIATTSDEPTIKDLFRIIQQQNEQIMILQRQVNNLKTSIRQPEIDSAPYERREPTDSPKKGLFSFDVKATSFEFSFRPQQQKFRKPDFLEPKIQEIVECENTTNLLNNSLHLDESLDVRNSYVSNAPSIAIEMDEYHSSDEEDPPEVGLTFYKDLMNQVNNALKKAQKQSECQAASRDVRGQTMKTVKQATLQHLKSIGVNLTPIQESSEVTGNSDLENSNQSEVSCAVQQLLMKYLPADKLAKVVTKPKGLRQKPREKKLPPQTEFSFATLQYMRKYNLIDNSNKEVHHKNERGPPDSAPRILDVTALKLQPKLL